MFIWDLKDNEKTSFKKIPVFDIALGEKEKNIDTRDAFVPINKQKILIDKYKLFKENDCPNANYIMEMVFIYHQETQSSMRILILFVMKLKI